MNSLVLYDRNHVNNQFLVITEDQIVCLFVCFFLSYVNKIKEKKSWLLIFLTNKFIVLKIQSEGHPFCGMFYSRWGFFFPATTSLFTGSSEDFFSLLLAAG